MNAWAKRVAGGLGVAGNYLPIAEGGLDGEDVTYGLFDKRWAINDS